MPTPPVTLQQAREALDAYRTSNSSKAAAARSLGMQRQTFHNRLEAAVRHGLCSYDDIVSGVSQAVAAEGLPAENWSIAWLKQDDHSILVYNPDREENTVLQALDDTVARVKKHSPSYLPHKFPKLKDPHMLVVNVTDLHFGAYGLDESARRLRHVVDDTIARSTGFNIEKIIFIGGSDLLHTDTAHMTTTKGTPVDHDGSSWAQVFEAAQTAYVTAVETLIKVAPVHFMHCSGNHDELMGYALSRVIAAWFDKNKHITFDVTDASRKYTQYGSNLLCFTHGDKLKETDIPMVMAQEASSLWGNTTHRYCYMGHFHHQKQIKYQTVKEHPGVTLEWLRAPKPTDKWHRDRGFLGGAGYKSFIHSKDRGQVASLSGTF